MAPGCLVRPLLGPCSEHALAGRTIILPDALTGLGLLQYPQELNSVTRVSPNMFALSNGDGEKRACRGGLPAVRPTFCETAASRTLQAEEVRCHSQNGDVQAFQVLPNSRVSRAS